ncbi:acyl-CoA dehydrogenase family protein [Microbacterium sp. ASV49]|uniref:Acyl-CoA dehydrogenase family protein n=1 Tax=Microbacterium candidum TaxID=3041922 RepID=A0ABT7MW51_9MICO|nr:acyl-CoA dehydrogenase family protein [Microbacterium sp. ASV49]MDL9978681.1 acyl-CoA dehydrogenase family protein [Microbacterium sp. ASV49]
MTLDDPFVAALAEGIADARDTDFFRLDDRLGPAELALRAKVRGFVEDSVLPVINHYWERAEFPFEVLPAFAELGVVGSQIEGYGCPGLTPLQAGIVTTELARGDGSLNTFMGVQSNLTMGTIALLGSEEQKQRWLPRMAALELIGAFALTEAAHGSDSVGLETTARREGDEWVLQGSKRWIGNASYAHVVVIWARDEADGKVKAFVMHREPDEGFPAGYDAQVITGKIGKRAILQPDIRIDGLRIPESDRLPGANSFRDAGRVLERTRGGASWESLGHALAAFEIAAAYASRREQFGGPIARFQLVQSTLAQMVAELSAIQLMCHRMAELQAEGTWTGTMASITKLATADKARRICQQARDLLGGNGLLLDFHVARHLTDMEVVHTYEGTAQIQELLIGRAITGLSAFS